MLQSILSYGLLALLAIALLYAVRTDLAERRIANWLNAAIALSAPLFWYATGLDLWPGVGIQLGLAAVTFLLAMGLFAIGQMGGGDVKLIAALALWFTPPDFLRLVVGMALLGYGLTMGFAAFAVARGGGESRGRDIALLAGLAVAAGFMVAQIMGADVIPFPGALREAAQDSVAARLALFQLPVLGLAIVTLIALRLFRKRAVKVETPYGVAIAGAALWVIVTQPAVHAIFT